MGETHETEPGLPQDMSPEKTRKSRRNGMWNIFEGVDNSVLEKLGLSEELVHQLVTEADDTVSEYLATHHADEASLDSGSGCHCRKARILRSFSATVGEDMKAALQNRRRRNAVGNLFDVLTPSQKLLLVEHLQEQLERLRCQCGEGEGEGRSPAKSPATVTRDSDNSDIILALTDFTSSSSTDSATTTTTTTMTISSSGGTTPVAAPSVKEEVACH